MGRPEIVIALADGPVALNHRDLAGLPIRELPREPKGACRLADSVACTHGTFVEAKMEIPDQGESIYDTCHRRR